MGYEEGANGDVGACRDEVFLRKLVGRLKRIEPREKGAPPPWRKDAKRCKLYHEHADGHVSGDES